MFIAFSALLKALGARKEYLLPKEFSNMDLF